MQRFILLISIFLFSIKVFSQNDSTAIDDSALAVKDTNSISSEIKKVDSLFPATDHNSSKPKARTWKEDTTFTNFFKSPFVHISIAPVFRINENRLPQNKDELFYLLIGIISFLAFIRLSFSKYFQHIFKLFFQSSFRLKQTRETLLQDNLPGLFLNILFVITGGLFITFILQLYFPLNISFWWIFLYCSAILAGAYLFKYLFITFSGWVFNEKEAASTYIFIVFLINKILGIFLIPLLLLLAFSEASVISAVITVASTLVILLLLYRYAVSLSIIKRRLKIKPLHFFIYLCAVELIPLLIIYKALLSQVSSSI